MLGAPQVVGYFWEYAKALDEDGKKKLLSFITSSDRVPVGGCRNLRIVISKHGTDPTRCDAMRWYLCLHLPPGWPDHACIQGLCCVWWCAWWLIMVHLFRLPSAHTCFNHLLLPEYESLEQLRERFDTAISEGEAHCSTSAATAAAHTVGYLCSAVPGA